MLLSRRVKLHCFLALSAPSCWADDPIRLAEIAGCYGERYEVRSDGELGQKDTAYRYIKIERDPVSHTFSFIAETTGGLAGNLHYCSAGGDLQVTSLTGGKVVLRLNLNPQQKNELPFPEEPCPMKIIITSRRIVIEDFDQSCHTNFMCGVGAHLNAKVFSRRLQEASICKP